MSEHKEELPRLFSGCAHYVFDRNRSKFWFSPWKLLRSLLIRHFFFVCFCSLPWNSPRLFMSRSRTKTKINWILFIEACDTKRMLLIQWLVYLFIYILQKCFIICVINGKHFLYYASIIFSQWREKNELNSWWRKLEGKKKTRKENKK